MPWSPNGADISDKKKAQMLLTFLNTYKDDLVGGTNKKFVTDLLKFMRLLQFVWRGWEESKQRFS
ncbi:hypothetical protein, partial [uncultured Fibrobacter sp.]|uniref:hypothetical protein n=1 Tax=uncultured Fibrobacter sp. TaxID=261512 RepID=UPI0025E99490